MEDDDDDEEWITFQVDSDEWIDGTGSDTAGNTTTFWDGNDNGSTSCTEGESSQDDDRYLTQSLFDNTSDNEEEEFDDANSNADDDDSDQYLTVTDADAEHTLQDNNNYDVLTYGNTRSTTAAGNNNFWLCFCDEHFRYDDLFALLLF